jgi:hypothetical protein
MVLYPTGVSTKNPRRSAGALAATSLGFLIAFFPKCPMCWAAFLSGLGISGISKIPYPRFLFPFLVVLLGGHLLLLIMQASHAGYGPFLISVAGALTLLFVRYYVPEVHWALNSGIVLMLGGSVWNSFSVRRHGVRWRRRRLVESGRPHI